MSSVETRSSTAQKGLSQLQSPAALTPAKKAASSKSNEPQPASSEDVSLVEAIARLSLKNDGNPPPEMAISKTPSKVIAMSSGSPNQPTGTEEKKDSSPASQIQRVVVIANKELFMRHLTGKKHPECPLRVEAIERALQQAQLMDDDNTIKPRAATKAELTLCHDQAYLDELAKQVAALKKQSDGTTFKTKNYTFENIPGDFQISPDSFTTSLYAAGGPLTAIDYILDAKNKTTRAFCIVRPPGHHAHQQTGSGFCIFNNVAIAAKYLSKQGYKTAIIDWDAHHGDGTQELVEDDKSIYYFSTHKDTESGFYPGPHWGHADQTGKFDNVMNCPVSGDNAACRKGILDAFPKFELAMDIFKPDVVLISCGFDAHENDSLVGLGLKDEDYKDMTEIAVRIANKHAKGRIVSVLEGGYDLDAISGAAKVHVAALKG